VISLPHCTMLVVKKYSNRRLYDTRKSGYITLDELAETIRTGTDVQVVDAKTGADLTQATLAQIILDSRGAAKLLPVTLLTQLIRMGDEALAEFMGKYLSFSLEMYQTAKRGADAVQPYFPLATLPFTATNAMARMLSGMLPWQGQPAPAPSIPSGEATAPAADDIATLRAEIDALKRAMKPDETSS
jgi:polyhydroxyalkanoate synthesis repressor PhaR